MTTFALVVIVALVILIVSGLLGSEYRCQRRFDRIARHRRIEGARIRQVERHAEAEIRRLTFLAMRQMTEVAEAHRRREQGE